MSELNQVIHASHVARVTGTSAAADVLREVGRSTTTRGAAEVVNEVDFNFCETLLTFVQESSVRAVLLQWGSEVDFNLGETIWTRASHRVVTMEVRAVGDLEVVQFRLKFGVINTGVSGEVGAAVSGEVRHGSK